MWPGQDSCYVARTVVVLSAGAVVLLGKLFCCQDTWYVARTVVLSVQFLYCQGSCVAWTVVVARTLIMWPKSNC